MITVNTTVKLPHHIEAYNMHAHQIIGGAGWLGSEKYDVMGRPDTPGQPSREQLKLMIQKLLADRFQLKFHIEKRGSSGPIPSRCSRPAPKFAVSPGRIPGGIVFSEWALGLRRLAAAP